MKFENGKLNLQGIDFTIPDGYKENESAQKLAEKADDPKDAKYSVCSFINGDKEIITKVYFSDDTQYNSLTPEDGTSVEKTMAGIKEFTSKTNIMTTLQHSNSSKTVKSLKLTDRMMQLSNP